MNEYLLNRIANCRNEFQGNTKKVLCVCSAGLLRSPTAAVVLSQPPYNFNTRAAGLTKEFALIAVDRVLLEWADEIVCMDEEQEKELSKRLKDIGLQSKLVINLNIPDIYYYRDTLLMELIDINYNKGLL